MNKRNLEMYIMQTLSSLWHHQLLKNLLRIRGGEGASHTKSWEIDMIKNGLSVSTEDAIEYIKKEIEYIKKEN